MTKAVIPRGEKTHATSLKFGPLSTQRWRTLVYTLHAHYWVKDMRCDDAGSSVGLDLLLFYKHTCSCFNFLHFLVLLDMSYRDRTFGFSPCGPTACITYLLGNLKAGVTTASLQRARECRMRRAAMHCMHGNFHWSRTLQGSHREMRRMLPAAHRALQRCRNNML